MNAGERVLNCAPSRDVETDWTFDNAVDAGLLDSAAAVPPSRDLREDSWWEIDDQGETGSCVGWATANSVLRWHFVKSGLLPETARLSARYVWMASKEMDLYTAFPTTFIDNAGTSLKSALDIVRKFGAVTEFVLPFGHEPLYAGRLNTFYAMAARFRISSYFSLGVDPVRWRQWLAFNGPVLTRLDVDESWMSAAVRKGGLDEYRPETTGGGHAVALVGYTPDGFIVRNSWGRGWGDEGYAYAREDYALAAFTESYGVVI